MFLVAAIASLFGRKKQIKQSDKYIPNREQRALMDSVSSWFEGTNIGLIGFDLIQNDDDPDLWSTHICVGLKGDYGIPGVHFDINGCTWTQPWDPDQHGEEGKASIAEAGMPFERQTANVELMCLQSDDIIEAFGLNCMAGDQLQFNDKYYWIAKK